MVARPFFQHCALIGRSTSAAVCVLAAAILGAALAALPSAAGAATGPAPITLEVSANGSGTACTTRAPCSITTAQSQARNSSKASKDVVVELAGGTYQLSVGLTFTSADSGINGHRVTYRAVAGQTPVLSGGRSVTGWSVYSSANKIWSAPASGIAAARQLYVNGVAATLASAPASTVFGALSLTSDGTGYVVTAPGGLKPWSAAADQPNLVYDQTPNIWAQSRCGITSAATAAGGVMTMASPCLQNLAQPWTASLTPSSLLTEPTLVENNLALVSQPGQFFIDSHAGRVYYIPRANENLSTATVVVPQVGSLLSATGVSNLTISGLTFSYGNWVPSATQGVVDVQSNLVDTTSNSAWAMLPSNVVFSATNNVIFSGNKLTHLGGGGVSVGGGGTQNTVSGNVVADVAGTGITVGSGVSTGTPDSGDQVTNNYVHHVAIGYQGGNGIFAGYVAHTTIAHNEVWGIPGTGVALGWGWGSGSGGMTDNHVDYNRIHDVNSYDLFDGGAIYVNGTQAGTTLNSSITGNYVWNDPQPFGAIYLDSGSSNLKVSSNVIAHTSANWLYLQTAAYGTPAIGNDVEGNYTDSATALCLSLSDACALGLVVDVSNVVTNNITGLLSWPSAAQNIIAAAGLQTAYAGITGGSVDTNLADQAAATATTTDPSSAPAGAADDVNSQTSWTSGPGDAAAMWQADLGAAKALSNVQVLTNQGNDNAAARAGLSIAVSNSPITAGSGTMACTLGGALPFQGSWNCTPPAGTWRYVAVVATGGNPLSLAEVRAYGH